MEALPGANKPQWYNRRQARPPEGKEGKHHSGPFPRLPQIGPDRMVFPALHSCCLSPGGWPGRG